MAISFLVIVVAEMLLESQKSITVAGDVVSALAGLAGVGVFK